MTELPTLTRRDLTEALEKRYPPEAAGERRTLVAYYGTGARDIIETATEKFEVVPVPSELGLREELLQAGANPKIAFLVPWSGDLPLDLAGRFSGGGRVLRIGVEARLKSLFGVREVDADARESPLAKYLLRRADRGAAYSLGVGRLTRAALFEAWLGRDLGVEVQGGLGLDLMLAWAATDAHGPEVATALTSDAAPGVRDALLDYLERALGPTGPLLWKLWESGRGRRALELGLLFEPTVGVDNSVAQFWIRSISKQELGCAEGDVAKISEALAKAAPLALRAIERRSKKDADTLLRSADALDLDSSIRPLLRESPRLPSAWQMRKEKLGETLSLGAADPSRGAVERARAALHEIERHAFFRDEQRKAEVTRAEMALRLLAWLAAWKAQPIAPSPVPQRDAEELGAWYTREGGYVDWARRIARGGADSLFDRGVQAIVEAADRVRAELDLRFARSLARWLECARPANHVVPIEQALKSVGARFLSGHTDRSLLVLLLDGMAWAQAVELLESLGARGWGPLTWHSSKEASSIGSPYPVVFAGLPTITEVSRAEFFAGKLLAQGEPRNTSKDPERFAAHRDLKDFVPSTELPRLLLRGEGHSLDGSASEEALSLVRDTSRRIAGIVVNAIDDSLKSSTQQTTEWTVDHIRSLAALLDAARDAGRSVLIASDHGHVPGGRLMHAGTYAGSGARYRPWLEGEEPRANEIGLSGSGVSVPKGSRGVILLADEVSRYGSAAHSGEHGGATLAEVIAPCFLIGTDDPTLEPHEADKALLPKPAHTPDWWQFEVWSAHEPAPEKPKPRVRSKPPDPQMALPNFSLGPPEPPPAPARKPTPRPGTLAVVDLESPFARSDVLKSRAPKAETRKRVVAAVQYLLDRQGVSSADAFATALDELPYRVSGLVASFQEVLNIDGYAVLSYDAASRTVKLDREMLAQQFEVKQ